MSVLLIKEEERHILRVLPILLKQDRKFQTEVYSVLSETFAKNEDVKQILDEMRISREESNKRFEEMRQESNKRFEQSDKRFEEMRQESNKRFEQMDKRFEIMQEQMDKRFDAMQEQMDKRFDAMQEQMDKRFDAMQEQMDKRFQEQKDWVGTVVGGFQRRAGRSLEDAVAGTLRVALRKTDVKSENLKLRTKIKDDEGIIGAKDREYEIDLYIHNSESIIFEVKSYLESEDIFRFNDKAELTKKKFGLSDPLKVIVSLEKDRESTKICEELGVILA